MSRAQREAIDQLMRESPLDLGGDIAVQRPILEQILSAHPLPDDVVLRRDTTGGVGTVSIQILDGTTERVVLFFHGGAYALGSAAMAAGLGAELARRIGARVISVDYRLAPEHPYPAALRDALAAYRGLLAGGIGASRVSVAGESAGGGLAMAMLLAARAQDLPLPGSMLLFSPWVDLTLSGESMTGMAALDPSVTRAGLERRAADYVASANPEDGLISPVFADLRGLPPVLIQVGSHEVLLDDATRLAARAAAAHVEVVLDVTPAVPHVFQAFAPALEEADAALTRAARFVREHAATDSAPARSSGSSTPTDGS